MDMLGADRGERLVADASDGFGIGRFRDPAGENTRSGSPLEVEPRVVPLRSELAGSSKARDALRDSARPAWLLAHVRVTAS